MDTQHDLDGLVARRKTNNGLTKLTGLSRGIIACLAMMLFAAACKPASGQKEKAGDSAIAHINADTTYKPKVDIQVNRRFDNKGNLIGFDSTYSTYYSNVMGDTSMMDSLMGGFDTFFKNRHSSFLNNGFRPLFFNDSSRYPDFFHNDFFLRRYELNDLYMRDMMKRMDSIKNNYYKNESQHNRHS
jgi:hypothetical protein